MEKTLLDKAYANLIFARDGFRYADDEAIFDLVGYHIQQAIEVTIKYEMEMNGAEYAKMHNIRQLLQSAAREGLKLNIPEYIDDHAEMFTEWESCSRYTATFSLEEDRARKGYNSAVEYFVNVAREYEPEKYSDAYECLFLSEDSVQYYEDEYDKNYYNDER